jgi:hypothetical protein
MDIVDLMYVKKCYNVNAYELRFLANAQVVKIIITNTNFTKSNIKLKNKIL